MARQFHKLTQILGYDHDLAVLHETLTADETLSVSRASGTLSNVISQRRLELQEGAFSLGKRLYADKPKTFVDRLGTYWDIWFDEGKRKKVA